MEETLPPTVHVLRPHHVGLLKVFMLTFKEDGQRKLPAPFILHIYRVLLNEVSEIAQRKSHLELILELSAGQKAETEEPQNFIEGVKLAHNELQTADQMTDFFHAIATLFVDKEDEEAPTPLWNRSIFGYFCRRCFVSFIKLSFSGVVQLRQNYQAWCTGDNQAGYEPVEKDQLTNAKSLLFKTQGDKKAWAQPDSFAAWEKGHATADDNLASESLRRFFEQHFHDGNDSGIRQYALLNLGRMHYTRHEYTAARKLLREAITVARTTGDKVALQHCISLMHRLPPAESGRKPVLNTIQPDLHPLEVLFDVTKLMQIQNGQPLSASFDRIIQAIGLYDCWSERQQGGPIEAEQWAQHAMQAIVWTAAGCDQLSSIEENIVTGFTAVGGDDNNRVTVTINRAYKWARHGKYTDALAMLLEPDVWRGITLSDYVSWASQIWHILVLRASRRGQHRLFREFLGPRKPPGEFDPREYFANAPSSSPSMIRDPLYEVIQLRQCNQATAAIEQLLNALWHSEYQSRLSLYRTAIILLADVGLEFGMTKRCRRIIEEIMPQVINGNDLEQRALGCFTLARCIIAAGSSTALQDAIPYLLMAEADFSSLQILRSLMDVQFLLSVVYHNLGSEADRDDAAKRHFTTEAEQKRLEAIVVDGEVRDVWQVVSDVGAALASR